MKQRNESYATESRDGDHTRSEVRLMKKHNNKNGRGYAPQWWSGEEVMVYEMVYGVCCMI